jgi:hypothetical protein
MASDKLYLFVFYGSQLLGIDEGTYWPADVI